MAQRTLFTIGHSNHEWAEFVALLKAWKIEEVVDVRTVPKSRALPRFWKTKMEIALPKAGIGYMHLPELGGLRHAKKDSKNIAWRNASFRGYADYMQTEEFARGLSKLNQAAKEESASASCAPKPSGGGVIGG